MYIEYIDKKPKVSLMRHLNMGDVFIFEPDTDNLGACIYLGEHDNGLEQNFLIMETEEPEIQSKSNKRIVHVQKLNARLVVEIQVTTKFKVGDIINWIDGTALITDILFHQGSYHYEFYLFDTDEYLSDFVLYMDGDHNIYLLAQHERAKTKV